MPGPRTIGFEGGAWIAPQGRSLNKQCMETPVDATWRLYNPLRISFDYGSRSPISPHPWRIWALFWVGGVWLGLVLGSILELPKSQELQYRTQIQGLSLKGIPQIHRNSPTWTPKVCKTVARNHNKQPKKAVILPTLRSRYYQKLQSFRAADPQP